MMKLHWSPRSPFVRKVMIVLEETGLTEQLEQVRSVVAMPLPPNEAVMADNPLGKIPTLVTEEGKALFDSRVICEYLDLRAGTGLFPADPTARVDQLTWQALGDGLTDILLLWRTELTRETGPWEAVTEGWLAKVRASMARLESEVPDLRASGFGIGLVAVICALGQLDFRWPDCGWRDHFPALAAWEAEMAARASVSANPVVNDQGEGENEITLGRLAF
ncbi:glutathione S-transferase family protein [Mameliella alba]|uniref:Glutathione S-transferase domain protein n=1 Tax=Mameliella alba TaxID=561184 RepID=A0A0B3SLB0_9RHOB|nr:glutathione S-transferase N-terminal domain-containing protein [Mameliella alba]KHQ51329.1 Glutathione S-transferase domain protein [Mameliella alba]